MRNGGEMKVGSADRTAETLFRGISRITSATFAKAVDRVASLVGGLPAAEDIKASFAKLVGNNNRNFQVSSIFRSAPVKSEGKGNTPRVYAMAAALCKENPTERDGQLCAMALRESREGVVNKKAS